MVRWAQHYKGEKMGMLIVFGLVIWSFAQPYRVLPHALLAGYFGLNALALLGIGTFSIWFLLYAGFAIWSGSRAIKMRRSGASW
jgi:hypothetical protein